MKTYFLLMSALASMVAAEVTHAGSLISTEYTAQRFFGTGPAPAGGKLFSGIATEMMGPEVGPGGGTGALSLAVDVEATSVIFQSNPPFITSFGGSVHENLFIEVSGLNDPAHPSMVITDAVVSVSENVFTDNSRNEVFIPEVRFTDDSISLFYTSPATGRSLWGFFEGDAGRVVVDLTLADPNGGTDLTPIPSPTTAVGGVFGLCIIMLRRRRLSAVIEGLGS